MGSAVYSFPDEGGPDSPWPVFEECLNTLPDLEVQASLFREHEIRWAFVMRRDLGDGGQWIRDQRRILGTACMPRVSGHLAGLFDQLLEDTLGYAPDFLITLDAEWWGASTDRERLILVAHELSHCGHAVDRYGVPKFTRMDNRPVLTMVAHDIEEFTWLVRRFGAWKSDLREFIAAANGAPQISNGPPPEDEVSEELTSIPQAAPEFPPILDGDLPENVSHVDSTDVF